VCVCVRVCMDVLLLLLLLLFYPMHAGFADFFLCYTTTATTTATATTLQTQKVLLVADLVARLASVQGFWFRRGVLVCFAVLCCAVLDG